MVKKDNKIAEVIKEARKKRGLTQEQLAERVGISQSQLSYIERGGRRIHAEMLLSICKELNIKLVESVLYDNEKVKSNVSEKKEELSCKRREYKTERAQLLLTLSTKTGLQEYAQRNGVSLNDIMEKLGAAFLEADQKGSSAVEFDNATFFTFKK